MTDIRVCGRCGRVDPRCIWMADDLTGTRLLVCQTGKRNCRVVLEKLKGFRPVWAPSRVAGMRDERGTGLRAKEW